MNDLAWTEEIEADVEDALPPAVRHVLKAMRELHREEAA